MGRVRRARGIRSVAISDITGFEVDYKDLVTTWDGLKVEPEEYDPKQPQLTPRKNVFDATALKNARPDDDQEPVFFFVGYNYAISTDRNQLPPVGIHGKGSVGFVNVVT
jgi:hypothetical protein